MPDGTAIPTEEVTQVIDLKEDFPWHDETMPLQERLAEWVASVGRSFTTEEAVACGLGIPVEKVDKRLVSEIGGMLHRLGCVKFRPRQGRGKRPYLWEPAEARSEVA